MGVKKASGALGFALAVVTACGLTDVSVAGPVVFASDSPPARAFGRPRLEVVPARVLVQCQLAQARTRAAVLCPTKLPRAWLRPWSTPPGTPPPALSAQHTEYLDRGGRNLLMTFGYGAPWEPDAGPGWQQHLWRNRPCCLLHFEIFTRIAGRPLATTGGQHAVLAGHRGIYLPALGNRVQCGSADRSAFWCNHAVFIWRQQGIQYAATLHYFGSGTRALLARLASELGPVEGK
jgi:hypothetical protein